MLAINIAGNEYTHKRTNERTYRQSSGFEFNQQETICRGSPSLVMLKAAEKRAKMKPNHHTTMAKQQEPNYGKRGEQHTIELRVTTKEIHVHTKRNFKNKLHERQRKGNRERERERESNRTKKKSISVSSTLT